MIEQTERKVTAAQEMARKFFDIPIAMTVLNGKVYGTYIGDWKPYTIPADFTTASLALEMGLFTPMHDGEIDGQPVKWWMNRRS